jgi:glycosyltransferase involved in cell wall biosynthesis
VAFSDSRPNAATLPVATADKWRRRFLRWTLFAVVLGFGCAILVSFAGLALGWGRALPLLAGGTHSTLLIAAAAYATWIIARPLMIASRSRASEPPMDDSPDPGASIVIPCCDAAYRIGDTVETILAQTYQPLEIVLVENNSTDSTWSVCQELERQHPGVVRAARVDVHEWEYACSVAVNVGVRMARYESIIRMDCDTMMAPEMVAEAVSQLGRPGTSAVAVNLRLSNAAASLITRLQSVEYLLAMELDRRFQVMLGSIVCCSGGLSAYRRSTIVEAGGFCSAPKWVSEDLDMTMKAHRLGNVRMAPRSIGYTWAPETLRGIFRQRVRWGTTGIVAFYLHHRGIARRSYWFDGRVGFCGLPLLGVIKLRDMLGFGLVVIVPLTLLRGGWEWLAVFGLVRMVAVTGQLLLLLPILRSKQGVTSLWLVPAFIGFYGPLLLAARCVGAWRGIGDIRRLRKRIVILEHAGLDPQFHLSRGLDVRPTSRISDAGIATTAPSAECATPPPRAFPSAPPVAKPSLGIWKSLHDAANSSTRHYERASWLHRRSSDALGSARAAADRLGVDRRVVLGIAVSVTAAAWWMQRASARPVQAVG